MKVSNLETLLLLLRLSLDCDLLRLLGDLLLLLCLRPLLSLLPPSSPLLLPLLCSLLTITLPLPLMLIPSSLGTLRLISSLMGASSPLCTRSTEDFKTDCCCGLTEAPM